MSPLKELLLWLVYSCGARSLVSSVSVYLKVCDGCTVLLSSTFLFVAWVSPVKPVATLLTWAEWEPWLGCNVEDGILTSDERLLWLPGIDLLQQHSAALLFPAAVCPCRADRVSLLSCFWSWCENVCEKAFGVSSNGSCAICWLEFASIKICVCLWLVMLLSQCCCCVK